MSDGSSSFLSRMTAEMDDLHAAEIEAILLTHYHSKHSQQLGRVFQREIVRSDWLPAAQNEEEDLILRSLVSLAEENGVAPVLLPADGSAEFCGIPLTVHPRT